MFFKKSLSICLLGSISISHLQGENEGTKKLLDTINNLRMEHKMSMTPILNENFHDLLGNPFKDYLFQINVIATTNILAFVTGFLANIKGKSVDEKTNLYGLSLVFLGSLGSNYVIKNSFPEMAQLRKICPYLAIASYTCGVVAARVIRHLGKKINASKKSSLLNKTS